MTRRRSKRSPSDPASGVRMPPVQNATSRTAEIQPAEPVRRYTATTSAVNAASDPVREISWATATRRADVREVRAMGGVLILRAPVPEPTGSPARVWFVRPGGGGGPAAADRVGPNGTARPGESIGWEER